MRSGTKNGKSLGRLPKPITHDLVQVVKAIDRYHHFVRWSEGDQVYVGYCPDLYFGGVCHGDDEEAIYSELGGILRDEVVHRAEQGEPLPEPSVRVTRDVEMQAVSRLRQRPPP